MIILNRDGTLTTDTLSEGVAKRIKETIEVPEHLVTQQPDLIDRILSFAFDGLGLQAIDVRIRPASLSEHPTANCSVLCA
jgi:hypothetical protein